MATPTHFQEQNDWHTNYDGFDYPIWRTETMLGKEKTTQVISVWQLSPGEIRAFRESEGFVFIRIVGGQPPIEVLWANTVPFEGQNAKYTHPDCYDLPVHIDNIKHQGQETILVTSAWQLSKEGKQAFDENGGIVFLRVVGGQPYVTVTAINPF